MKIYVLTTSGYNENFEPAFYRTKEDAIKSLLKNYEAALNKASEENPITRSALNMNGGYGQTWASVIFSDTKYERYDIFEMEISI